MNNEELKKELGVKPNGSFSIPCSEFWPVSGQRELVVERIRDLRRRALLWFDDVIFFAQEARAAGVGDDEGAC